MYSVTYINEAHALGVSLVYDDRMFISGPRSVFLAPRSGGGRSSVRPVCYLSRRASRRRRR